MSSVARKTTALGLIAALWAPSPAAFGQSDPDVAALQVVFDVTAEQHGGALQQAVLMDAALAGVAGWLNDFHQSADHRILTMRQYQAQQSYLRGEGYGFGIDVRPIPGHGARVVDVFKGSPAEHAGLTAGMTILGLNGNAFAGLPSGQILGALRTAVSQRSARNAWLNVVDDGGVMDARAVRLGQYRIPPLSAAHHDDHSFITLRCVCPEAASLLQRALADNGSGRMVLDLRHAEGDDLDDLLAVTARLVGGGQHIGTFDVHGRPPVELRTGNASPWEGRIAVLIGEGTRGTPELLAHALQTQRDVPLFGIPTAGETRVLSYHALPGERVLQTVAGWIRGPDGVDFTGAGVAPDASVESSVSPVISPLLPSPDLQYDSALKWLRSEE